ncbi:MAG: hypothetical protein EOO77_40670, partial [Oxalobacteraceae bacterium]
MPAEMIRGTYRHGYDHPHRIAIDVRKHTLMVDAIREWLNTDDEPTGTYTIVLDKSPPAYKIFYEFSDYGTAFALKMRF